MAGELRSSWKACMAGTVSRAEHGRGQGAEGGGPILRAVMGSGGSSGPWVLLLSQGSSSGMGRQPHEAGDMWGPLGQAEPQGPGLAGEGPARGAHLLGCTVALLWGSENTFPLASLPGHLGRLSRPFKGMEKGLRAQP